MKLYRKIGAFRWLLNVLLLLLIFFIFGFEIDFMAPLSIIQKLKIFKHLAQHLDI